MGKFLSGLTSALSLGLVSQSEEKSLRDQAFGSANYPIAAGNVAVVRSDYGEGRRPFPKRNVRALRNFAEFCPYVRAAIDIIRGTVERAEWRLNPADATRPMNARVEREVRGILEKPDESNTPYSEMQGMQIEDYLVLGHGVMEKKIRRNVEPYALKPLDAARIGFYPDWDGDQKAPRYAYFDRSGLKVLRQLADPMVMMLINRRRSYDDLGLGHVETLDMTIRGLLEGDNYTLTQTLNPAPMGAFNLGTGVTQPQVDEVRRQIEMTLRPFFVIGGTENAEFIKFNASERDLRILASMEWYVREVAAVFQIPVAKLQLFAEKQNRASTETQFSEMDEGVAAVMRKVMEMENRSLVGAFGPVSEHNVRIDYPLLSAKDAKRQADITKTQIGNQSYISINDARKENGQEPIKLRAANVPLVNVPKGAPIPLDLYDALMYDGKPLPGQECAHKEPDDEDGKEEGDAGDKPENEGDGKQEGEE